MKSHPLDQGLPSFKNPKVASCVVEKDTAATISFEEVEIELSVDSKYAPEEGEKLKVEGTSQVVREGLVGWISYDQNEGSKVSRKLPLNWYKNNDLLGFALCSVHVPPDKESEDGLDDDGTWSLKCELTIEDGHQFKVVVPLSFQCWCVCDIDDDVSSQVWVTYYPKITFPSKYASNKRRAFLKAAFQGYFNGEPVKVENCGIHLIYAHEQEPVDEPHHDVIKLEAQ
ncbi:hypothetical protein CK203_049943 [Vitis vinifera]|uniref:C-JID domain-containing protein n=1 Tax=Vitis vinifera TaxID=29760 RepID=A0A438GS17_VITVI|nr:hypothetical protein CK203_049943 [Vitis vinifera]